MAHTCPECDCICHCGGDIDDIIFGENINCQHYLMSDCDGYVGDDNEGDWDDDDLFDDQDPWPDELIKKEDGGLEDPETGTIHYP